MRVRIIDDLFDPPGRGVRATLRRQDAHALLILVNEDPHRHLGVDVSGLEFLEGRQLELLYGSETTRVKQGGIVTRLQGFEVKVFSTDGRLKSRELDGRNYDDNRSR